MKKERMKILSILMLLIVLGTACQNKTVGDELGQMVTVKVKVEKAKPNQAIYFYERASRELLDSVFTDSNGELTLKVKVKSPKFYGLNIYNQQNEAFILGSKNIEITAAGVQNGKFEVKGSKDNDFLQEFTALKKELNTKSLAWQEKAYANPSNAELQEIIAEQQAYAATFTTQVKTLIEEMDGSIAAIEAARILDIDSEANFLEKLAATLVKKYPDSKLCKDFKEEVDSMTRIAVGRTAPDFELTTDNNEQIKLSDYRGKYVLVDFWASWCGPCRRENPFVTQMYQKYGGKNFEILGVSTDQSEVKWRQAIREDGLQWAQVRDTQYDVSTTYNVSAIPFTILLDREGQIIAKNLRGVMLAKKLEELL